MSFIDDVIRRSRDGKARVEDIPYCIKIGTSTDSSLKIGTVEILKNIYDFAGFAPFLPSDILECGEGDVKVVLDDTETRLVTVTLAELEEEKRSLEEELKTLNKLYDKLKEDGANQDKLAELSKKIEKLEAKIDDIDKLLKEKKESYTLDILLLGYYKRRPGPEIHLMMGTLKDDYELAIVFIHELMHAYFDFHKEVPTHPDCSLIEEPIAECGMLCFIEMFERLHPEYGGILERAKKHVEEKVDSLGVCHYGYGYYLYNDKANYGADWVSLFHKYCPVINMANPEVKAYEAMISPIRYPRSERSCEEKLYAILRPKRFCFINDTLYYPATPGCSSDRMIFNIPLPDYDIDNFLRSYPTYMGKPSSVPIQITFESKSGNHITGEASVLKGSSASSLPRLNIKKDLVEQYKSVFGPVSMKFKFFEVKPSEGGAPAEWLAQQM